MADDLLRGVFSFFARMLGIGWANQHQNAVAVFGAVVLGGLIFGYLAWRLGKATERPGANDEDGLLVFRGGVYLVFWGGLVLVFFAAVTWAWRYLFG